MLHFIEIHYIVAFFSVNLLKSRFFINTSTNLFAKLRFLQFLTSILSKKSVFTVCKPCKNAFWGTEARQNHPKAGSSLRFSKCAIFTHTSFLSKQLTFYHKKCYNGINNNFFGKHLAFQYLKNKGRLKLCYLANPLIGII